MGLAGPLRNAKSVTSATQHFVALGEELLARVAPFCVQLLLAELAGTRLGDGDEIDARGDEAAIPPETLTTEAFDSVAHDSSAYLLRHNDTQPRRARRSLAAGRDQQDEVSRANGATFTLNAQEICSLAEAAFGTKTKLAQDQASGKTTSQTASAAAYFL